MTVQGRPMPQSAVAPARVSPPTRRWSELLRGIAAADVPLGVVATVAAKGWIEITTAQAHARRGFGLLYSFAGGGGELHVYTDGSATEPEAVTPLSKSARVSWADAALGAVRVTDSSGGAVLRCPEGGAHEWYAALTQLLRGAACDEAVSGALQRLSLPAHYQAQLALHGFESARFLRAASARDLAACGIAHGHARALLAEVRTAPPAPASAASPPRVTADDLGESGLAFKQALYAARLAQAEARIKESRASLAEQQPAADAQESPPQGRQPAKELKEGLRVKLAALLARRGQPPEEADALLQQHCGYEAELINSLCSPAAATAGAGEGADPVPQKLQVATPGRPLMAGVYSLRPASEVHGLPVWDGPSGAVLQSHANGRWVIYRSARAAERGVGLFLSDKHFGTLPHAPAEWLRATRDCWEPAPDLSVSAPVPDLSVAGDTADATPAEEPAREAQAEGESARSASASSGGLALSLDPTQLAAARAATPAPPATEWAVGDKVEVRDSEHEDWAVGTVDGYDRSGAPLVRVEGWESALQWRQIRRPVPSEEPAAAEALGGSGPRARPPPARATPTRLLAAAQPQAPQPVVPPSPAACGHPAPPLPAEIPPLLPHLVRVLELNAQGGWKREAREKHKGREIVWESKPVPRSPIHAARYTTVIDCSMEQLVRFLQVPENIKRWDKTITTIDILEDLDTPGAISMLTYMAMKMPMIQGRDMVSLASCCLLTREESQHYGLVQGPAEGGKGAADGFHRTAGAKTRFDDMGALQAAVGARVENAFILGSVSSEHAARPVNRKYERARVHAIGLLAVPAGNAVKLTALFNVDPGGKLPAWAVNVGMRDKLGSIAALQKILHGKH